MDDIQTEHQMEVDKAVDRAADEQVHKEEAKIKIEKVAIHTKWTGGMNT